MLWPIIAGIIPALVQVVIVSFSAFVLSSFIFLNHLLQKDF